MLYTVPDIPILGLEYLRLQVLEDLGKQIKENHGWVPVIVVDDISSLIGLPTKVTTTIQLMILNWKLYRGKLINRSN